MSQKRANLSTLRESRASTSTPGVGGSRLGAASPTSPTRTSRLQEKEELQHLNDRLACYIDRVRNLENENNRLTQELQLSQDTVSREVSNIKSLYEKELAAARKMLDETAREKAKLEIDIKRLWEENDELKQKLDKKIKDCGIAENNARIYESRYNDINGKYNAALADRKKAEDQVKGLTGENAHLHKQLDDLRKQLEAETLARVDLENQNQSLREELSFKDQIHVQELTETRSRRQIEISEIDGRLSKEYEAKMQQSLQELRDQYESQMRANRDEIELLYDNEIKNLQAQADRAANASARAGEDNRLMRNKIDTLNSRIEELQNVNASLNARIRDAENTLDTERMKHNQYIESLEAELQRMRDKMAQQLQEYQDLMDIKVSLDLEIAAYDKLLGGEERRLNITSPARPNTSGSNANADSGYSNGTHLSVSSSSAQRSGRATPSGRRSATPGTGGSSSAIKRRCTVIEESEDRSLADYTVSSSSTCDVTIVEADRQGRFVKLLNKSNEDVLLMSYSLTCIAGNQQLTFKFIRSHRIIAGQTLTIWSVNTGGNHDPLYNLVMKKKWPVGDSIRIVLHDSENKEVASYERVRSNISTHASSHKQSGSGFTLGSGPSSTGVRSLFSLLF